MAYSSAMLFIETSIFTKEIQNLLSDDHSDGKGVVIMKKEDFEKLVASIKEAGEIKAGNRARGRVYEIKAPEIKTVREKLNVSQGEFALMIGASVRTLQNWE